MVKLAIRDDDANFFTKIEDLEFVYRAFKDFPVSFAIIHSVTDVSTIGSCPDTRGNTEPKFIGDNNELCNWFKLKLKEGKCDVLLHGVNHSYKILNGKKLAEMEWRDNDQTLNETICRCVKDFEKLFDYTPSVFVAPSNLITKNCLKAVTSNSLNFSGIIPVNYQRELSLSGIKSYFKRWLFRFFYKFQYPGRLIYRNHIEVNACALISFDKLVKLYSICEKYDLPMAINVHYWHLRDNPEYLEILRSFVMDYAVPKGAIPSKLSDIFEE